MGVAQNNKLKFQRPHKYHPFYRKGPHVKHFFSKASLMKDDMKVEVSNETPKT